MIVQDIFIPSPIPLLTQCSACRQATRRSCFVYPSHFPSASSSPPPTTTTTKFQVVYNLRRVDRLLSCVYHFAFLFEMHVRSLLLSSLLSQPSAVFKQGFLDVRASFRELTDNH